MKVVEAAPVVGFLVLLCAMLSLCACAETRVYSDENLRTCDGVKYFPVARPIMLVKQTDSCGNPVDVAVQYVPDLSRPRYVTHRSGIGKTGWTLTCKDGIAKDFHQSSADAGVDDVITTAANAGVAFLAGKAALEELNIVEESKK